MRFEVLLAVKFLVKVFQVVTLCNVAVGKPVFQRTLLPPSSVSPLHGTTTQKTSNQINCNTMWH